MVATISLDELEARSREIINKTMVFQDVVTILATRGNLQIIGMILTDVSIVSLSVTLIFIIVMYQRLLRNLGYLPDETRESFEREIYIESQEYVHDIDFYDDTIPFVKPWIPTGPGCVSENSDILANDKTMEKEILSQNSLMALTERNNKPIQKERDVPENLPRVIKDQPLLAPDKRQDKDFGPEPIPSGDLDWNKVFTFLVNIIEPSTWRLFFVELFGYGEHLLANGQTTNSIIEHIKLSNNGATSELFFGLFQEWIRLMGSEAKPSQIETALESRMDNLALSKFRQFMRTPPLKPERTDLSGADNYLMAILKPPINSIDIHSFPNNISFKNPHIQVMALHQQTQNLSNVYEKSPFVRSTNQELIVRGCRNLNESVSFTTDNLALSGEKKLHIYKHKRKYKECFNGSSSSEDDEDEKPRCKYRKQHTNSVHTSKRPTCKGKRRNPNSANYCREQGRWDNEFVVDIIKRFLPTGVQELKSEEYYLFLDHTISVIMKKAGVPERTVLAMMLDDFNDRFERKTKRGHVTCTIDTSQEAIMIGYEESECLQLYVDHARKRVIRKLKEKNRDYVEYEYVFIGIDGIPMVNESFEDTIVKETESEKKALTCSTLSQESVQMESSRKDLNDDKHVCEEKIQTSEVQDMKMNHLSFVKTNLIGVSNYDEPKLTEDFSLLVEKVNDDRDGEMNDNKNQELNDDKPICKGILKTSGGQDNIKLDDLCLGKEQIVNFSKYDESKSTEEFSLTCEEIDGDNMENKNDKGELYSMKASPTRPSKPGLPTRSPAGQSEKITKSNSKTTLDQIGIEEITVKNKSHEDFILDIEDFLASDK